MNKAQTLNKSLIRARFERATLSYDTAATVAYEAGEQMLARLSHIKYQPRVIIDIGSGTGHFSRKLSRYYRQAQIIELDFAPAMLQYSKSQRKWQRLLLGYQHHYICADIESLPFQDQSVDMIWSNFSLLWQSTPDQLLKECYRVLNTGGLFMCCTLGPDSLKELRTAFKNVDSHAHVHNFIDMHDMGDAMLRYGFQAPVMDMDYINMAYDKVDTVLQDLKLAGATNALLETGTPKGLMGKKAWRTMLAQYEALRKPDGSIPVTYEIIYGHAWKGDAGAEQPGQHRMHFHPNVK